MTQQAASSIWDVAETGLTSSQRAANVRAVASGLSVGSKCHGVNMWRLSERSLNLKSGCRISVPRSEWQAQNLYNLILRDVFEHR